MSSSLTTHAIGIARTTYRAFGDRCDYQNDVNTIEVDEEFEEGLLGTEFFSNLFCIYYQHLQDDWKRHAGHDPGEVVMKLPFTREPTCRGVFSKRSPARPAKLGSCIVTLVRREGRKLYVKGLDAIDGSPVVDLKPYIAEFDAFPLATAPMHWCASQTTLLRSSRLVHWDTVNVTMALGFRAGMRAMHLLDISRRDAEGAKVTGPAFFAHGIEATTGCSILRGELDLQETDATGITWTVVLRGRNREVQLGLADGMYADAAEVLGLSDDVLFSNSEVRDVG